jgi:hypothetical protein
MSSLSITKLITEHEDRLSDISACTGLNIDILKDIYMNKVETYFVRDKERMGQASEQDYTRAINVIQRYVTKNYNYCESWIE